LAIDSNNKSEQYERSTGTSEKAHRTEKQESKDTDGDTIEKIYFGEGAELSGWIPFALSDIEDKIIPIIQKGKIDDREVNGNDVVKINSTKGVELNGWVNVEKSVVKRELDPIADDNRKNN
jgi:hypothetical protein